MTAPARVRVRSARAPSTALAVLAAAGVIALLLLAWWLAARLLRPATLDAPAAAPSASMTPGAALTPLPTRPSPAACRDTVPPLPPVPDAAIARQTLEGYSWVDRSRGVVRIPIARAMELVAAEQR
ncbi:MAG TPA: hypothetical protein VFS40_12990 [Gemmatimonadales bacterium]|nr:hypothetical protein [Gemmatimonadales bacterium]